MNNHNGNHRNLEHSWKTDLRWEGITRPYSAKDVERLRGSVHIEHTLARLGAERLWQLLQDDLYVAALGALTGNQAVQQVAAGLKAIYMSGWQVAADANDAGQMYPDQSLYPADSVPNAVRKINQALARADQIHQAEGQNGIHWFAPIIADAEAGFGGNLNAFELMKAMIEAGAACVHFEDQLSSAKKCGHLGGKVLVPTTEAIQKLVAARLAADVMGVPTLIMARTDADSANLLTSDIDPRDAQVPDRRAHQRRILQNTRRPVPTCSGAKPPNRISAKPANSPKRFTPNIPTRCWRTIARPHSIGAKISTTTPIAKFQRELGKAMGYKFQFITLAGFHALNLAMYELARNYKDAGLSASCRLQERGVRQPRAVWL